MNSNLLYGALSASFRRETQAVGFRYLADVAAGVPSRDDAGRAHIPGVDRVAGGLGGKPAKGHGEVHAAHLVAQFIHSIGMTGPPF